MMSRVSSSALTTLFTKSMSRRVVNPDAAPTAMRRMCSRHAGEVGHPFNDTVGIAAGMPSSCASSCCSARRNAC